LVERKLPKLEVAGSKPVRRSFNLRFSRFAASALVWLIEDAGVDPLRWQQGCHQGNSRRNGAFAADVLTMR
jgi:hypothetical protein